MRWTRREALALTFGTVFVGTLPAQNNPVELLEVCKPGDLFQYEIGLNVTGKLKVDRGGKVESLPLTARARHTFIERVEATAATGAGKTLRLYSAAASESRVAGDRTSRELAPTRRRLVAQRAAEGTLHFCPEGPLSRDELDLVAEHFDTLGISGLLPGKSVAPGDTWKIADDIAQAACLFQGISKNELTGKLTEIKDGAAFLSITGKAEGIEHGANVRVSVNAQAKFDLTSKLLVGLKW
ncbi:MAG: hypothetical protein ACRCZF_07350, partial [Gemmataceae bacterium]